MTATAIIVCSDDRALALASVLKSSFSVYRRSYSSDTSKWIWSVLVHDDWQPLRGKKVVLPKQADVLFFHTGLGDPAGIDDDIDYKKEFGFSGAGFDVDDHPAERKTAHPVVRRFEHTECPVKPHHVQELCAFIKGERDKPGFCKAEIDMRVLTALSILCQTYLVAGIAEGELTEEGEAAELLGWQKLPGSSKLQLRNELSGWWKTTKSETWWLPSLGVPASDRQGAEFHALLQGLVDELDYLGRFREGQDKGTSPEKTPSNAILSFLAKEAEMSEVAELLKATNVSPSVVVGAYRQVKKAMAVA